MPKRAAVDPMCFFCSKSAKNNICPNCYRRQKKNRENGWTWDGYDPNSVK